MVMPVIVIVTFEPRMTFEPQCKERKKIELLEMFIEQGVFKSLIILKPPLLEDDLVKV